MVWLKQYEVTGRKTPTGDEESQLMSMKIFAPNKVVAKSRYWYNIRKMKKVKKTTGDIISVKEVPEKKSASIKNFGVWVKYKSRSDTVNMYKEYRDVTMAGAVEQFYMEMSGRHRARWSAITILKVQRIASADCKRPKTLQMLNDKIRFPLPHRVPTPSSKQYRTTFKARRPNTICSVESTL
mmetsp:Transcript_27481/g.107549  ORF Transcript_27481/g.107549 Transcript_27481/m.107549 type:complete len:182 (-) Transcript_27481:1056-1601(-)